ncbi:MAG TPA: hypothetical protein VHN37_02035 [Actinomycetota bacterium]|nr:hypothetical protein [Actinomycetota bacterium]
MSTIDRFLKIEDLFLLSERRSLAEKPEMDPLTEDDALMESQLIDLRYDPVTSTTGLLFDLRQAIQLRLANTGVVIVREVERLAWEQRLHEHEKEAFADETLDPELAKHRAWNVIASEPRPTDVFNLRLLFVPGAELNVSGARAEFFMGHVPGIGDVPATFTHASVDEIEASLPHWNSPFKTLYATFLDGRGR